MKVYYELHLSHDNEGLKADILKHEGDTFECVEIITTFEDLYRFIANITDNIKFIITTD